MAIYKGLFSLCLFVFSLFSSDVGSGARIYRQDRRYHCSPYPTSLVFGSNSFLRRNSSNRFVCAFQTSKRPGSSRFVGETGSEETRFFTSLESEKTVKILEDLKTLTLIEVSELVGAIEKEFNLQYTIPGNSLTTQKTVQGSEAANNKEQEEDEDDVKPIEIKTEFDVQVISLSNSLQRIPMIKYIKSINPSMSLKEAKDLLDSLPKVVKSKVSQDEADEIKKQLEQNGAIVKLV